MHKTYYIIQIIRWMPFSRDPVYCQWQKTGHFTEITLPIGWELGIGHGALGIGDWAWVIGNWELVTPPHLPHLPHLPLLPCFPCSPASPAPLPPNKLNL